MPVSLGEAEGGAEGQVIAFLIAAGYYPSFGPSKKMPKRRFSFQNDPVTGAPVGAMGLLHRKSFTGAGVFPSGPDLARMHQQTTSGFLPTSGKQRRPMHEQKEKGTYFEDLFIPGTQFTEGRQYRGRASVREAIIADVTNRLRGTLISKAARYRLRGNYVWWNSGVDDLDTLELSERVYSYMTAQDPDIFSTGTPKERTSRAERLYDVFMDEFEHFERVGGGAKDMTREMVNTMVEQDLSGENMVEYARETFENALSSDVPEEDDAPLRQYMRDVVYLNAEEQFGTSNKTDILMRIESAAGTATEIEADASETLMGISDEYSIGKHGWIRAFENMPRGWRDFEWMEGDLDREIDIAERIGDHMITEITENYNPVIQDLIAYTRTHENTPAGEVPTLEQIMGPLSSASAQEASGRGGRYVGATPTMLSEGGGTGADFLAAVQAGHFTQTQRLMGTWPDAAHAGVMQYIFKMMSALGQDTGRTFLQSQRITKRDPKTNHAYYAFIPMSSYVPGDADFLNTPYEFRTSGENSPEYTAVAAGPNATLALLSAHNKLSGLTANFLSAIQHNFYSARKAHSANVQLQTDGSLLSTTDAAIEDGNKHSFTISWSPKNLNEFFENFIQRIVDGMSEDKLKTLADKALNPQRLGVDLNGKYSGFWGLPYIGFEDNLVRKKGEASTWFNEAQEQVYGGLQGAPAPGGRWMSPDGRIYGVPG